MDPAIIRELERTRTVHCPPPSWTWCHARHCAYLTEIGTTPRATQIHHPLPQVVRSTGKLRHSGKRRRPRPQERGGKSLLAGVAVGGCEHPAGVDEDSPTVDLVVAPHQGHLVGLSAAVAVVPPQYPLITAGSHWKEAEGGGRGHQGQAGGPGSGDGPWEGGVEVSGGSNNNYPPPAPAPALGIEVATATHVDTHTCENP